MAISHWACTSRSAVRDQADRGVGTSTAGFIGLVPDSLTVPVRSVTNERVGAGDGTKTSFTLPYPILTDAGSFAVRVNGTAADATVSADGGSGNGVVKLTNAPPDKANITGDFVQAAQVTPVPAGQVVLCTTFSDFVRAFGDFSLDPGQRQLAHAVYGFFDNGGTRCFVAGRSGTATIDSSCAAQLRGHRRDRDRGRTRPHRRGHARRDRRPLQDPHRRPLRHPGLAEAVETGGSLDLELLDPSNHANAAAVEHRLRRRLLPLDQRLRSRRPSSCSPPATARSSVPPSGHVAGIYARVDTERGVHKAPANELVARRARRWSTRSARRSRTGSTRRASTSSATSTATSRVWGARTLGGDANADLALRQRPPPVPLPRESIDQGTQWVVFEPNDPALWAKITRNVTAFLTNVWRAGALFGATAAGGVLRQVRRRDQPARGARPRQVVTEIGVAIVRPAEFVIFRISQWAGPAQ